MIGDSSLLNSQGDLFILSDNQNPLETEAVALLNAFASLVTICRYDHYIRSLSGGCRRWRPKKFIRMKSWFAKSKNIDRFWLVFNPIAELHLYPGLFHDVKEFFLTHRILTGTAVVAENRGSGEWKRETFKNQMYQWKTFIFCFCG